MQEPSEFSPLACDRSIKPIVRAADPAGSPSRAEIGAHTRP
jgi:hypothetical protein